MPPKKPKQIKEGEVNAKPPKETKGWDKKRALAAAAALAAAGAAGYAYHKGYRINGISFTTPEGRVYKPNEHAQELMRSVGNVKVLGNRVGDLGKVLNRVVNVGIEDVTPKAPPQKPPPAQQQPQLAGAHNRGNGIPGLQEKADWILNRGTKLPKLESVIPKAPPQPQSVIPKPPEQPLPGVQKRGMPGLRETAYKILSSMRGVESNPPPKSTDKSKTPAKLERLPNSPTPVRKPITRKEQQPDIQMMPMDYEEPTPKITRRKGTIGDNIPRKPKPVIIKDTKMKDAPSSKPLPPKVTPKMQVTKDTNMSEAPELAQERPPASKHSWNIQKIVHKAGATEGKQTSVDAAYGPLSIEHGIYETQGVKKVHEQDHKPLQSVETRTRPTRKPHQPYKNAHEKHNKPKIEKHTYSEKHRGQGRIPKPINEDEYHIRALPASVPSRPAHVETFEEGPRWIDSQQYRRDIEELDSGKRRKLNPLSV